MTMISLLELGFSMHGWLAIIQQVLSTAFHTVGFVFALFYLAYWSYHLRVIERFSFIDRKNKEDG